MTTRERRCSPSLAGGHCGVTITVVLDRIYDLDDIVDAHRRVDSGHKVGNVIVRPCLS